MSLLSVTVKKANFVGPEAPQYNTYVTLKLQNVKSTTVTVKGPTPCWEQDFLFETNDVNTGLLIEVWSKGMIWDRAMGYHWLPLQGIQYSNEEGTGQWLSLEAELVMRDGEVVGTKTPTGHALLVDCRFELPFGRCDPPSGWRSLLQDAATFRQDNKSSFTPQIHHDAENIEASDLQRKLELLNNVMDHEARAEQARRQIQYYGHSGYSEDSDYTSDLNYPVGQHANSSASQFRTAAHQMRTPQMSLETSRENSYERDDAIPPGGPLATPQLSPFQQHHLPVAPTNRIGNHLSPGSLRRQRYSPNTTDDYGYNGGSIPSQYQQRNYQQENNMVPADSDPLFYNSRPRNKTEYTSYDKFSNYNQNYNYDELSIENVDKGYSDTTDLINQPSSLSNFQKPSLERQTTLDYTSLYDGSNYINNQDATTIVSYVNTSGQSINRSSYDEYFDASSYPYHEERYGRDQDEDRQWDAGGLTSSPATKRLPPVPLGSLISNTKLVRSTVIGSDLPQFGGTSSPAPRRIMPQVPPLGGRRATSRQGSLHELDDVGGYRTPEFGFRGASLPPTPTKLLAAKLLPRVPFNSSSFATTNKAFNSLPPTPGRQLPLPKPNHRSANKTSSTSWSRRSQFSLKRTISADYADELLEGEDDDVTNISGYDIAGLNGSSYTNHITNTESNSYIRPGTMSANQLYNEDYNYAYQSTDNLPTTSIAIASSVSTAVTVSSSLPTSQPYQPIIINSGLGPLGDDSMLDEISPYGEFSNSSGVVTSDISNTSTVNAGYDSKEFGGSGQHSTVLHQQYSTEDYYYNAQDDIGQISDNYLTNYDLPITITSTITNTSLITPTTTVSTTSQYNLQERRKLLLGANGSRRGTSPLGATLHPNDSFDSRDEDTLRDSFETAVSSMDYPLISSYTSDAVSTSAGYDVGGKGVATTTYTQYQRDQPQIGKTSGATTTTTTSSATAHSEALPGLPSLASGFSAATSMFGKMSGMAKGFLKQQTIDPGIFSAQPQQNQSTPPTITTIPTTQPQQTNNYLATFDERLEYEDSNTQYNNNQTTNNNLAQLERFNSIDSYLEEEDEDISQYNSKQTNGGLDYNRYDISQQVHGKDSGSNGYIDEEQEMEEQVMRRGSSQITVVDPYAQQQRGDYESRRTSQDGYMMNGGQSIRRTSQDSYHEYMEDEDMMADNPVSSSYQQQTDQQQYNSYQPIDHPHLLPSDVGILEDVAEEEELEEPSPPLLVVPVEKKVSFEDEEVVHPKTPSIATGMITTKVAATVSGAAGLVGGLLMDDRLLEEEAKPARQQITAQQRWHWAYNKIIMQLNSALSGFVASSKGKGATKGSQRTNAWSNAPGGYILTPGKYGDFPVTLRNAIVFTYEGLHDFVSTRLNELVPPILAKMTAVLDAVQPVSDPCLMTFKTVQAGIAAGYPASVANCLTDGDANSFGESLKDNLLDSVYLYYNSFDHWATCFNQKSQPRADDQHAGIPSCCARSLIILRMMANMPKLLMGLVMPLVIQNYTQMMAPNLECVTTDGLIPIVKKFLTDVLAARACYVATCGG